MTAWLDIEVLILDYCFYLGPVTNHPFDDRPEYSTHICMIGSRFINPHFPAVLCKSFLGPEGRVCSFCVFASFRCVPIRKQSSGGWCISSSDLSRDNVPVTRQIDPLLVACWQTWWADVYPHRICFLVFVSLVFILLKDFLWMYLMQAIVKL